MSQPKSVEAQLKEAIEASKQTLALSEQVTSLASEKETLSKRLAEIEASLAPRAEAAPVDEAIIKQLASLVAERDSQVAAMKAMSDKVEEAMALSRYHVVEAKKAGAGKADLKEYVKREEGAKTDEDKSDAEIINESGKEEACGPMKGKKAKAEMPDFIKEKIKDKEEGEDEEEASDCKPMTGKKSKKAAKAYDDEGDYGDLDEDEIDMIRRLRMDAKAKKADSTLSNPTKEDSKDFGKVIPQTGLDQNKNTVNDDNTTSPTISKSAKKVKAEQKENETDVEEIMESVDMQKEEGEEGHKHEKTLSEPEGKKAKSKAENSIGGVNKQEVTRTKEEVEEAGEGSFINKKDAKGKKAEEAELAPVAEVAVEADPLEAIVTKFAKMRDFVALESKAKTEAHAAVEAMTKKFESLAAKLAEIEASDKSVEMKAAKIVSSHGVDPVASAPDSDVKPKTDADVLNEFEAIKDKREQNKFFNANRGPIERAAMANMKRRS
jgi:hypothetical protein